MTSIWAFLLQTLTVSMAAILLLAVKWILKEHLSPRWQYGVWSLLALRVLLPANLTRRIFLPLPIWVETWKALAERGLASAYAEVYAPISLQHVLPVFSGAPESLTDWLLVAYAAGVGINLLWRLLAYARLRRLLRGSPPASEAVQAQLRAVGAQYGLKVCRAVEVPGLPSAFVCGVFRPLLAVPAGTVPDDKVLLHELLHLKHRDVLQGVGWSILRALHWCNPFLQYVFNRIGNDMESLCDQRVLERLTGEARREYGDILLRMANEQYARAAGTSSLSNGGKNIARRIAAIVRFKRYPRGMALVSVCILVALCSTVLGTAAVCEAENFQPKRAAELERAMATARVSRCGTVAGALDTYAKGLLLENGVYIAAASPHSRHGELAAAMERAAEDGWMSGYLDSGPELEAVDRQWGYQVFDLVRNEDGSYHAYLAFALDGYEKESGARFDDSVVIPLRVSESDGWVVEESGARMVMGEPIDDLQYDETKLPWLRQLRAEGETGTVTVSSRTCYFVDNTAEIQQGTLAFFGGTAFDEAPKLDAEFDYAVAWTITEYTVAAGQSAPPRRSVGIQVAQLSSPEETVTFESLGAYTFRTAGGSSTDGRDWATQLIDEEWDGTVDSGGGEHNSEVGNEPVTLPAAYRVQLIWDGSVVEELTVKEAGG